MIEILRSLRSPQRIIKMSDKPASVFDLSPAEKLQLIEDLWDDLSSNPDDVPIHDWQKEELDRRYANFKNAPGSGLTWEEVVERIRSRHAR
jgi:putative addiction module component (TIGR02574 family)